MNGGESFVLENVDEQPRLEPALRERDRMDSRRGTRKGERLRNRREDTPRKEMILDRDEKPRTVGRSQHRRAVERAEGSQAQHSCPNALLIEDLRGVERRAE